MTSEDAWSETVAWALEQYGQIDVLVNNAGVFLAEPLATTSLASFNKVLDVNVVGVFLGMREVAAHMSGRGSGSIINVSSLAGLTGGPAADGVCGQQVGRPGDDEGCGPGARPRPGCASTRSIRARSTPI